MELQEYWDNGPQQQYTISISLDIQDFLNTDLLTTIMQMGIDP
jgi:hypothetical protein